MRANSRTRLHLPLQAALLLTLALAAPRPAAAADRDEIPASVARALDAALGVSGGRLELAGWKAGGSQICAPTGAEVDKPVTGSGRYAVKIEGPGCTGWGWATVRVFAPAFVTTRSVRAGERLDGAVREIEKEVRMGRAPVAVATGDKAARALGAGQVVEDGHVDAAGPGPGETIKIVVRSGALAITQSGRVAGCSRGHTCAVLPSGKHVEGQLVGDTLIVEVP